MQFAQLNSLLKQIPFMNRFLLAAVLLSGAHTVGAQYYYNDIIAARQTNAQFQSYRTRHVQAITGTSYESDEKQAEGFELTQTISPDYKKITTIAAYPSTGPSYTTHYYTGNKLVKTEDSTARVMTRAAYTYDAGGRLTLLQTTTSDGFMNSRLTETHLWTYKEDGTPAGMLKLKDGKDTTEVNFTYDSTLGYITEEHWMRKGVQLETWYYYYNDQKQLTDIVRYNARAKRLLPDYLFEYDAAGHVTQMTQIAGSPNYMVWKYIYDSKGLKIRDLCFNKQKQLVGRIEYQYTFLQ